MYCSIDVLENFLDNRSIESLTLNDLFEFEELINCFYESFEIKPFAVGSFFNGTFNSINFINQNIQETLGLIALYSPKVVLIDNIYSWFSKSKMKLLNSLPESDSKIHANFPEKRSFRLLMDDQNLLQSDKVKIAQNFMKLNYAFLKPLQEYIHKDQLIVMPYYNLLDEIIEEIESVSEQFGKSLIYENIYSSFSDEKFENSDEISGMSAMFKEGLTAKGINPRDPAKIVEFKNQRPFYVTKNLLLSKLIGANYCPSTEGNSALHMGLMKFLTDQVNYELKTDLSVIKLLLCGELPFFHNGTLHEALKIRQQSDGFNEWRNELVKTVHTYGMDFSSKGEVKQMTREIFSPVVTRIALEIKKSKALKNYFSSSDLFAFMGGYISRYYSSSGDIEKCLIGAGITGAASIAGKILMGYGKPKLTSMDNFIYNILRFKK